MIKIPTYDQQTSARGELGGRFQGGPVESTGQALTNVGQGFEKIDQAVTQGQVYEARLLAQQQKANDDLTALANVSQAHLSLSQQFETLRGQAKPGAFGFAGDVGKMVEDYVAKASEQGGTEYYQQQFKRHMIPVASALMQSAMAYEAQEARGHRLAQVDSAIADGERLVAQNPGATEIALGRITSMLPPDSDNPFGVLPHDRDKVIAVARHKIVNAAINGWILRDPITADGVLNKTENPSALLTPGEDGKPVQVRINGADLPINLGTPEDLAHWRALARAEAERVGSNVRHGLDVTYTDHIAMFKDGLQPPTPLTRQQIEGAYAKNPAEGKEKADTYEDAQRFAGNIAGFRAMPTTELMGYLNKKPDATSTNYAREERLLAAQGQAAAHIIKQRSDDFIGWAATNQMWNVKPINWADPKSVNDEMRNRAQIGATARSWGNGFQVLSKAEADQLGDYLSNIQPQDKARLLAQIGTAGKGDALVAISRQLEEKGRQDYAVGGMLAIHDETVARKFFEGIQALQENRAKIDKAAETGTNAEIYNEIKGAYFSNRGEQAAARAAFGIYAGQKANGKDDVGAAVNLATGGMVNINGQKIPKPFGWSDSLFRDVMSRATVPAGDYIANGHALNADQVNAMLPGAQFVSYGDGTYAIRSGQGYVMDSRGQVVTINATGLRPKDAQPTPAGVVMPAAKDAKAGKRPF